MTRPSLVIRETADEPIGGLEAYFNAADDRMAEGIGRSDHKIEDFFQDFFRKEVGLLKEEIAKHGPPGFACCAVAFALPGETCCIVAFAQHDPATSSARGGTVGEGLTPADIPSIHEGL